MRVLLVTPKNNGNTYEVARHVETCCDAEMYVIESQKAPDTLQIYEKITICTGVYGDNMHKSLRSWLMDIDKTALHENAKFYAFLTWIGRGKSDQAAVRKIRRLLENKGLALEEDFITCFGKMLRIKYNHPNKDDYRKVLDWVKSKLN